MIIIGGKLDGQRTRERPKGDSLRAPILPPLRPTPEPITLNECVPIPYYYEEYMVRSAFRGDDVVEALVLTSMSDDEFIAALNERFPPTPRASHP